MDSIEAAIRYHEQTKHNFGRYARSLGYLDWDNQPNPFRRFAEAPATLLPLVERDTSPPFHQLYRPDRVTAQPLTAATLAAFLEHALGLSAWKEFHGSRWSLRCNPSSGNLHPTEGYVVLPPLEGLSAGPAVYHYAPQIHALECRATLNAESWAAAARAWPAGAFLAGLTSIHWREAWKYGERAFRYCQHDAGHAAAALGYSAATLGWRVEHLADLSDDDIATLLGLNRAADFEEAEDEHPDLLVAVIPAAAEHPRLTSAALAGLSSGAQWQGRANRLSESHAEWPIIDEVAAATRKFARQAPPAVDCTRAMEPGGADESEIAPSAWKAIRQRRSAVAMDGRTRIDPAAFYRMLGRTLPARTRPWDVLGPPHLVHLLLFVHRVDGLQPGLYVLIREQAALPRLRSAMKPEFRWEQPAGCPPELPLFLMQEGDARGAAAAVSCGQDIAGDSAFSLGMCAEFEPALRAGGAWMYRRLFWETGAIGQALYLEAEAVGVRATGIGCFFDDPVHAMFGLRGQEWQSLYHFTVGGAVEDTRLTTLPPYDNARHELTDGGRPRLLPS